MWSMLFKSSFLQKTFYRKSEMDKLIIVSCLFSLVMQAIRMTRAGNNYFLFLPWNLFLAYVPYFLSSILEKREKWVKNKFGFYATLILWVLFIPNSFYILTDLFHLELRADSHIWFDLTLIFSFAWNGLLLGILSVRQMERIFHRHFRIRGEIVFVYPVMWLIALGVYVGRYMRFNSWDVVTNPFQLIGDITYLMIHPFRNFQIWAMIVCFSVFMTILYVSVRRLAKAM